MTVRLATTYRQPGASDFGRPGGAWDVPGLDRLLDSPRPSSATAVVDGDVILDHGTLDGLASRAAGGLRTLGVRRGDVVAWQTPQLVGGDRPLPRLLAERRGRRPDPPPGGPGRGGPDDRGPGSDGDAVRSGPAAGRAGRDAIGVRTGDPRFEALLAGPPTRVSPRGSDVAVVAVHLGFDGQSQGGAALPPGPGLQGGQHGRGPRPDGAGRGPHAVTPGPRLGAAQLGAGAGPGGHDGGPHGEVGRRPGRAPGR